MKRIAWILAPLILALSVRTDAQVTTPDVIENKAQGDFANRMGVLNDKGDWQGLLSSGREWQRSNPTDPNGWWTEAWGAYNLGDVDTAIVAWHHGDNMEPSNKENARSLLENAQKVRANFPDLKLRPLQFVDGDAALAQREWEKRGAALLAAKNYDAIENTAQELQKTNAANVKGTPYLDFFFDGLCGAKDSLIKRQSRIAVWRTTRPNSNLARIASVQLWTDEAWKMRGGGTADTISPQMSERMSSALQKGLANMRQWPKTVFSSPLAFMTAIYWTQLALPSDESMQDLFVQGMAQFPDYQPLYRVRANLLMPRWFGEKGDNEKFVEERASVLGGDAGDIFYARMVWNQLDYYSDVWKETSFSYERFKKGMTLLGARFPESVSAANALMRGATMKGDDATAKAFFASEHGYLIDRSWWSAEQRISLASWRLNYLAK